MSQPPGPELSRYQRLIYSREGPKPLGRLLLQVLVRFRLAGNSDRIFPAETTLAEDTGLSVRSVQRLLQELEDGGWIRRKLFGVKGQAWRRTEYELTWPNGFDPKTDQWLNEVKARKEEGRRAYREEHGWSEPEPEPEPEPPPPPPPEVDMANVDREAWAAWISWRAAHGGTPSIPAQTTMAGMLRYMSAAEQRAVVQWSTELGHARPRLRDWRYLRWQEEHPEAAPPPPPEVHEPPAEWLPAEHVPARRQPELDTYPEFHVHVPPPPPIDPEPPLPGIEPVGWRRLVNYWRATGAYVTRQQAELVAQKLVRQASQVAWVDQVIARNLPPPPERETW